MVTLRLDRRIALLAAASAAAHFNPAIAQSRQVTTPNVTAADGATTVTVNGQIFINNGLLGAGRVDANVRDFRGETFGSFSGMAMDLSTWRRNADGSYVGSIFTLPDRGPFDGAIDYRNRVHTSSITFRPLASGSAALPQTPSSQSQLTITPTGGFTLKDTLGVEMTGRDPGASTVVRGGITYPIATDGTAAGHISLDAEAIAFRPDGTFYISDEYAAGIYHFDATGKQIGAIQTVAALLPRNAAGVIDFNSTTPGVTGRRNNQGLEAMTITPDNKKLATILQSATVQDTAGTQQQTRNNTRILIYDISTNATPTNPIGHYVLQLPTFNINGTGAAPTNTAAQSEMLALNDSQFLVLARDGLGRGTAANASTSVTPMFKSVLLVDITGATNLAGTAYETGNTPIATGGTLLPSIVPVQQVELINLLNTTQLARVGMNLTRLPLTNATSISEKWEAMALAPVLEEGAPRDFFLFVGNDNDFQATAASFNGTPAALGALDGTGNNDSVLLVYRLTLPTYVDPKALESLNASAPAMLRDTRAALTGLGLSANQPAMQFINAQRGRAALPGAPRLQLWADGGWNRIASGVSATDGLKLNVQSFTMGFDFAIGDTARIGGFGGYRNLDGRMGSGLPLDAHAWTAGVYGAVAIPGGLYGQASLAWLGQAKFNSIARGSAYGQQATGRTSGDGWAASGELGWKAKNLTLSYGPFVAADYAAMDLAGWTESGASLSNLVFPDRKFRKLAVSLGMEAELDLGKVRPALRAGYSLEREQGDDTATVRLAAAQHVMGTVVLPVAETARDAAFAELRLAMQSGPVSAYVSGRGRWGRGRDDARVSLGLAYGF